MVLQLELDLVTNELESDFDAFEDTVLKILQLGALTLDQHFMMSPVEGDAPLTETAREVLRNIVRDIVDLEVRAKFTSAPVVLPPYARHQIAEVLSVLNEAETANAVQSFQHVAEKRPELLLPAPSSHGTRDDHRGSLPLDLGLMVRIIKTSADPSTDLLRALEAALTSLDDVVDTTRLTPVGREALQFVQSLQPPAVASNPYNIAGILADAIELQDQNSDNLPGLQSLLIGRYNERQLQSLCDDITVKNMTHLQVLVDKLPWHENPDSDTLAVPDVDFFDTNRLIHVTMALKANNLRALALVYRFIRHQILTRKITSGNMSNGEITTLMKSLYEQAMAPRLSQAIHLASAYASLLAEYGP